MSSVLFLNGQVFDGVRHLGQGAVLVDGDRVVAVGDPDEVRAEAGASGRAEEVDLGGGLLTPGFLDAHMHPLVGGLERNRCEMTDLSTAEEYLDAIRTHHADQPSEGWFRGGGWAVTAFGPGGPTAELLDQVVPDRPAFLPSSDHHDAWVNTRALQLAGITADTPDPADGWFERDARGNPTGTVREGAMAMVGDHLGTTQDEYDDAMRTAQQYLWSWGITGWHDALVGGYSGLDDPTQSYLNLLASGELRSRVRVSLWWDRHRGTEQLHDLCAERERLRAAGLDADSVKIMVDGIAETFTAAVTEPYLDLTGCRCGDRGLAFLETGPLQEAVTALDAEGFAAHFHAIGDRAVHDALDAVEAARRANGITGNRHQAAHLQLVRPEDRDRFRALGVTANLEGAWAHTETPAVEVLRRHLDEERLSWHYPFADIVAAGTPTAGGSDWPVNPPGPIAAVHVLVNRWAYGKQDAQKDALVPDQGLTLQQAMATYTSGTARVNGWNDVGTIQVGSRADLAVLDRDPFRGPVEEIGAAEVTTTYLAGKRVHGS
ncbi:amidohydrolase [Nocardioides mesophilus]|uniref:Amidohydrolase n=1 Tax=Nocardioides mesophilus TaxID=433659 RepID=A0A7G9RFX5_9ACTN|nr:amidohydrolase [Nocardioides mesophilus]QNN54500.1 amidohydrolase [Nocardioides mesophilus]